MGNLIEKRSGHSKLQNFSYDCENRLVRAEALVNGKLESTGHYRYDSFGRRIAKQAEINGEFEQKRFLWQVSGWVCVSQALPVYDRAVCQGGAGIAAGEYPAGGLSLCRAVSLAFR
ncbi:hypothetical protein PPUN12996_06630 [Pseudomonas putida]|nr:hypothetical protein PPUN12996_06630 [Pseudomonas putida]